MWAAHASIASHVTDPSVVISSVALALPGVITASLLAGVAAGLTAALHTPWTRRPGDAPVQGSGERTAWRFGAGLGRRLAVTTVAGLVLGLAAGGVILAAYGSGSAVRGLAVTTAAAGVIGGALAALPPVTAVAAGVTGMLVVFGTNAVLTIFQPQLKTLFGAGDTVASQSAAAGWFSFTTALTGGIAAGLTAYLCLRRWAVARWPAYLLAGAAPGLLYLVAELITRLGGAQLLRLASGFSSWDAFAISYLGENRINVALAVGFIGGIIAMIAFGRTLKPPADEPAGDSPAADDLVETAPGAERQEPSTS
jgi:hypothetical protein